MVRKDVSPGKEKEQYIKDQIFIVRPKPLASEISKGFKM